VRRSILLATLALSSVCLGPGVSVAGASDAIDADNDMIAIGDSGVALDAYEATNRQLAAFLNEHGNERVRGMAPVELSSAHALIEQVDGVFRPKPGFEDHPAVEVSLVGARAYCAWAGKRVPTEAEWQAACEGPERLTFPWGHHLRTGPGQPLRANLFSDTDGYARTAPVGSFPEGRSPYGLWDMGGNVWEWALTDSGEARLRGGSWVNGKSMAECTGSNDVAHSHSYIKMNSVGVRCARTLTPSTEESPE
jgi:formylglycine-generating enzyme required for sulfatase activity